jgi:hypothetical protein
MFNWIRSLFAQKQQTIHVQVDVNVSGILHVEDKQNRKEEQSQRDKPVLYVGRDTDLSGSSESTLLQDGRESRSSHVEDLEALPDFSSLKRPAVQFGLEDSDYDSQDSTEEDTGEPKNA